MRRLPSLTLAGLIALILAVTLRPDPGAVGRLGLLCVFCGEHATADALANVILFMPLGAALAWVAPRRRGTWLLGLFLSLTIELAQRFIAGRDPSAGDVITNTLGTVLGLAAWRYATGGAHHPARRLWPLASLGFAATVGVTVWLLQPATTNLKYYGMWTPLLGQFDWYRGRVLSAQIHGSPLPPRPVVDPAPVNAFVRGQASLAVRFITGPPPSSLAPLVAVFDSAERAILVLGPYRDGLILRYRHRAAVWRLDEPDLHFSGATRAWAVGDTVSITVERTPRGGCLTAGQARACVTGPTPGRAWSLVLFPESLPDWGQTVLDILWVAGLSLLLGWCAGSGGRAAAAGLVATATLIGLPRLLGGNAASSAEIVGAGGGVALGVWLRMLARRA